MNTLTFLSVVLLVVGIVSINVIYYARQGENKIDLSNVSDDALVSLVQKLTDKIEKMEFEDKKLRDKITALQTMSGIEREQTKYLTANVNKTNSVGP
tara:strand:- start:506 stop:796 length:291 start_codon:yes stop_codon:yes gene_type:complete